MIPEIEKIEKSSSESFSVKQYSNKWFERTWHFHSEYELLLITSGHGNRVIGDNSKNFKEGDLVLVGGNIPHAWFSAPDYFKPDNEKLCESTYVQFDRSIFGTRFINSPELHPIQLLLDEAKYGLNLLRDNEEIAKRILKLPQLSKLDRMLEFIKILDLFKHSQYEKIISDDYLSNSFITKSERIKKVHEFLINNYMHDINLQEVAEMVNMNTSSFCRFFKKQTHRTFSQYVKEIRIDYAQQLLINTELPSNQVGFECGFSSVAYFNQCFKYLCKVSPLEYRSKYKLV